MDDVVREEARLAVAALLTLTVSACSRSGYEVAVRDFSVEPECLVEGADALPFASGTGTPDDPYVICTAAQLNGIGAVPASMTASFLLRADLDLEGVSFNMIGPFAGSFDGNGHIIANLALNTSGVQSVGMFSSVHAGTIARLTLRDPYVTSDGRWTGTLVGLLAEGAVSDCHATSSSPGHARVIVTNPSGTYVHAGGLVGIASGSEFERKSIEDSSAAVNVELMGVELTATYGYAGGLIGSMQHGVIEQSAALGHVYTDSANTYVGGLVGECYGSPRPGSGQTYEAIVESFATGDVEGRGYAGGLVGYASGFCYAWDSYASGDVAGARYIGGLMGGINTLARVSNSYSIASVDGGAGAGGFVGERVVVLGNGAELSACLWSSDLSPGLSGIGTPADVAGVVDVAAGALRERTTFTSRGWDFDTIWTIDPTRNDGYPILRWQLSE